MVNLNNGSLMENCALHFLPLPSGVTEAPTIFGNIPGILARAVSRAGDDERMT